MGWLRLTLASSRFSSYKRVWIPVLPRSVLKASLQPARLAFDHLVVMTRDEMETRSPRFEAAGYRLSAPGYHNLGSVNRLIVLNSSYIELLGWPAGEAPRRKEIAAQPIGLDALVFRSDDAQADQQRLQDAGFDVQPVSHLERPLDFHGSPQTARFQNVRFNQQPIAGFRVYYCQHLTPEYIWDEELMQHQNGAKFIQSIVITAPDALATARTLATLVDGDALVEKEKCTIKLPNLELIVLPAPNAPAASIQRVMLLHADGNVREFDAYTA